MADIIDFANDLIDNELSRALNKIRQNTASQTEGSNYCLECGDEMPKERQQLGFKLCVACVSDAERRKSLFVDE